MRKSGRDGERNGTTRGVMLMSYDMGGPKQGDELLINTNMRVRQ